MLYYLSILPYLIVFLASLFQPSDPDLGWHLKYGEYFFKHATLLRDNTFAVLMPNFHWANVSWGTDLITYATYAVGGFWGLTILGSLVITLAFLFFSKAARLSLWDEALLFPLILYLEKPLNAVSFRGQQISMLLLGVLVYLLSLSDKKPKALYLIIPLFLLWVNLHGEFILGLALFGMWIGLRLLLSFMSFSRKRESSSTKSVTLDARLHGHDKRREGMFFISIFILSCLATFINPFGIGVHIDAFIHIGSPLLKNVAEYLPFPMLSQAWWNQVVVAIFLILGFIFLYFKGKLSSKISIFGGILLLYLLSFHVRRYAWPAYYLILPILQPLSAIFKPDKKKTTIVISSILLISVFIVAFVDKYPFSKFTQYSWNTYCQQPYIQCSPRSADFLIQHKLTKNLFSLYGWGGWLIWEYPQIKPTIDGRMHIWVDEKGYSGFSDYYGFEQNMKEINASHYDVVYMSPDKPIYNHMMQLVKMKKWRMVYEDKFAGIFVRNK